MKQIPVEKKTAKMLISLILIVVLTMICLTILYCNDNKYTAKAVPSQDGLYIIPDNGITFLVDAWEFYPDQILSPQDFSGDIPTMDYYQVNLGDYPNLSLFHGDGNPYGVATYRLKVKGDGVFSLYLQEPLCAVNVYIGGVDMGGNGNVSQENYQPLIRDIVYQFSVDGQTELIVQTANYSHYYGGLYYPPALGNADSINRMIAARMVFYSLLCFSSLTLALFCVALWLGRKGKRDLVTFYFGLLSLSFALRVCYPLLRQAGVPLIRSLYALEDAATLIGIYCVVRISLILFSPDLKEDKRTIIYTVSMGVCAVGIVIPLFILPIFPAFTPFYGVLISFYKACAAIFIMIITARGVFIQHPYALFSLAGVTAYSICLFANIYFINDFEPIRTGWQDEYGSFILVLLFGAIMVQRSHIMVEENLHLTEHLQEEVDEKTGHLTLLLQERSQLMAELSHDMKSPITSLSNIVQIIRMGNILLDKDAQEKIKIMEERCDNLADRIRSIQKLTADTGSPAAMQEISLNYFLSEFHRYMQPVVEMSGPDFSCKLTALPCMVSADTSKLQRALENLVFNSADFTLPEGIINLRLERDDSYAYIEIEDSGCGIPKECVGKIFERFYTTRIEEGGQGLGLAITRAIVIEHRGEISVRSEEGVGTTFKIALPLLSNN